jgi:hypothetical protein
MSARQGLCGAVRLELQQFVVLINKLLFDAPIDGGPS